ncbi:Hypothetical Protein RradSPS_0510 [Rubrobacter radiotolerans]|uniref:Uncharacterized protein n=1 Tax=Rubrobacter radiotolerans TaxID=42256 RepID=A0A023X0C4_RUBRA|nr:hypothetical protein [Rubrobacter radiotolerans]AHY45793.1 Hypothetical Protein RradSPS_0510 [Rubrobacter radiotolerans]MDX5893208.1 hypothetical protein [Rubrobacter radiotolerans]SMC03272.1 conserved hypothetical protein [Rubrobacter radiotolerans DSM 5868]
MDGKDSREEEREEPAGETPEGLRERVEELEAIADSLGDVPDEEVAEVLDRALGLLTEINADVESNLESARGEVRELGEILDGLSFGSFDEALEDLERRERESDGSS